MSLENEKQIAKTYSEGEYVVFGSYGVCQVVCRGHLDVEGIRKDREYYTLKPCKDQKSILYTPVDNTKEVIRRILTYDEAMALIREIPDIECLWISDDKKRERAYKDALRSCDCREWVKIIKTTYQRGKQRNSRGKALTIVDKKYFTMAENYLYEELGKTLGMQTEAVKDYVVQTLSA